MSRRDHADMLKLSRPISRHPRMSMRDRAAQFAPFSALSGYQEIIASSARYRETRKTLAPESDVHSTERTAIGLKYAIRSFAGSPAQWFGLENSSVFVEYVPLFTKFKSFDKLTRIAPDERP